MANGLDNACLFLKNQPEDRKRKGEGEARVSGPVRSNERFVATLNFPLHWEIVQPTEEGPMASSTSSFFWCYIFFHLSIHLRQCCPTKMFLSTHSSLL